MPPKKNVKKAENTAVVEPVKKTTKPKEFIKKPGSTGANLNSNPKYYLVIDCPVEGESINHTHYTIRIGAPLSLCHENNWVEIAIDNGNWTPCRMAAGYFWFDWSNYPVMEHKIVARIRDTQGNTLIKSEVRKCKSTR
ncbi:MAG: hypothetical protein A2297_04035 [Elusimicrobia bacterium RIFOXYB2_FULL_48_7]|nr:MAG: hypothetical protein A2297_04035 [Elusimicrobia bacterium RIFOXYB2_FULL_48_7]